MHARTQRTPTDHDPVPGPGRGGRLRRLADVACIVAVLYGAAYGVARWRKWIVMADDGHKEERVSVRHTQPGFDVRTGAAIEARNARNAAVYGVFRPLCALEDLVRGGRTRAP